MTTEGDTKGLVERLRICAFGLDEDWGGPSETVALLHEAAAALTAAQAALAEAGKWRDHWEEIADQRMVASYWQHARAEEAERKLAAREADRG